MEIKGKHVLLTGGSRGIGPVIAEELAKRGAQIALAARSEAGLAEAARRLSRAGVQAVTIPVDLAQPGERKRLVAAAVEQLGTIDILINNAGLETEGAYMDLPWEAIQETLEVNLVAPMELAYLALPGMLARQSGHIVNMSSISGKCGGPYAATYSATKGGIAEWAQGLRLELAGSGVHISTIFPGYISEVGMFARFGMKPPPSMGSCTPAQVARAVVGAIEHNRVDVVVNSVPVRFIFTLKEISPALVDWLLVRLGVVDFQRKKVGL